MIMPGETARSHRHTPNALRLVLDAEPGAYTTVNGKRCRWCANDVVLTPNWCWHGHGNDGKGRAIWLDFLDVPLVHLLDPMFFEPHPDEFEDDAPEDAGLSPLLFPWRDTERRLAAAAPDPTGRHGTMVELGKPALDTMALYMMRLAPGARHDALPHHRQHALCRGRGRGRDAPSRASASTGRAATSSWRRPGTRSSTARKDGAVLFRVTDEPVMDRLGFLRSEAAERSQ